MNIRRPFVVVVVRVKDDVRFTFDSVSKWVIDDDGRLHVVGEDGNLASYNQGAWLSVGRIPMQSGIIESRAQAWDSGFNECGLQHSRQLSDPSHPITRINPYLAGSGS
jgi:hypothetical protein